jgi:hypothetical protein
MPGSLLAIYLNDHAAGAAAGADLAGRLAAENRSDPRFAGALERLAGEIREDRDTLRALMEELDVGIDRAKQLVAWTAEKAGRLKLNGRLLGYSPLSRVEELEALRLGVTGKRMLWIALDELSVAVSASRRRGAERGSDRLRLVAGAAAALPAGGVKALIERAERQLEAIEDCHARAIRAAFVDAG